MEIPKQLQDKLAQFQNLQNQLQVVAIQKQHLMAAQTSIENAQKELEVVGEGRIYRLAGPILIESGRDDTDKFLSESKETNDARIKILEKQEKNLTEKYTEQRKELSGMLGQGSQPTEGG